MGCSWPSFSSPSTVVISAPSACTANTVQDFTAWPFSSTVQAPQYVVSHPMCVPVSSSCSRRNSTNKSRGSTSRECAWPLTFTSIRTFCGASGINVADLYALAPCTAQGDGQCLLYECSNKLLLVFRRATYIRLWLGHSARSLDCSFDQLCVHWLAAKRRLGFFHAHWHEPNASQSDRSFLANVSLHRQLNSHACRWIDWCRALKGEIC